MQPVRIEAVGLREERCDLLGESHPDRLGPAARRELGTLRQRGNLTEPRRQNPPERCALVAAHFGQGIDDNGKPFDSRSLCAPALLLALFGLADFHHALECQQAVERRRRGVDARCERLRRRQHCLEHGGVDAHDRQRSAALHGQARLNRSARQALRSAGAYRRLDCVPARREAQPQIEPLAVDRLDLPGPGIRTGDAMAASKPGHARQRHRTPISASKESRADLSGGFSPSQGRAYS